MSFIAWLTHTIDNWIVAHKSDESSQKRIRPLSNIAAETLSYGQLDRQMDENIELYKDCATILFATHVEL